RRRSLAGVARNRADRGARGRTACPAAYGAAPVRRRWRRGVRIDAAVLLGPGAAVGVVLRLLLRALSLLRGDEGLARLGVRRRRERRERHAERGRRDACRRARVPPGFASLLHRQAPFASLVMPIAHSRGESAIPTGIARRRRPAMDLMPRARR